MMLFLWAYNSDTLSLIDMVPYILEANFHFQKYFPPYLRT